MESIWRDLDFAWRRLTRKSVHTVAALVALGLGVGANTAIFSVFDAVLLEPLAYPEADRLARLWETNLGRDIEESRVSPVAFHDIRENAESFAGLAGWWYPDHNLTSGEGEPERIAAINVTDNFFDTVAVQPVLGRGFTAGEDRSGQPTIAVISDALWQRRYGGDPQALGGRVTLDGVDYELVGVMPPGFDFPDQTEIWLPLGWDPSQHSRAARFFGVLGRLHDNVDLETARAEVRGLAAGFARDFPQSNAGWSAEIRSLEDDLVGEIRPALRLLFAAVGLVLLIACANVANLLLAQAASRQKEVALRSAIGAGRGRLLRQFLTESLVLGLAGGVLGLLVAMGGVRVLAALAPDEIPRLENVAVDARVLVFTLAIAALSGLVFGLTPALHALGFNVTESLKEGGRGSSNGLAGRRLRQVLVVGEIALALILLVGAGLLVRSFERLMAEDPGFDPARTISFNLQLPRASYADWTEVSRFYDRAVERLEAVPGVRQAVSASFLPLELGWRVDIPQKGFAADNDQDQPEAQCHMVSPGYFRLMGIPLMRGRDFDERDTAEMPAVAILNRAAAERYWQGEDPVGKVIDGPGGIGPLGRLMTESDEAEIIAVVGDVKNTSLEAAAEPAIYYTQRQFAYRSMNVLVKVEAGAGAIEGALKTAVWELDPSLPVARLGTLEDHLGTAVARRRFVMLLLACFAGLALVLAAIGTYGIMSHMAGERRREMGIRVALGARRGDIVGLIVGQGLRLAVAGIAVGMIGTWMLHRFMTSLVFGIATTDVLASAVVVALIATTALLACYLPARRAARANPVTVLRSE